MYNMQRGIIKRLNESDESRDQQWAEASKDIMKRYKAPHWKCELKGKTLTMTRPSGYMVELLYDQSSVKGLVDIYFRNRGQTRRSALIHQDTTPGGLVQFLGSLIRAYPWADKEKDDEPETVDEGVEEKEPEILIGAPGGEAAEVPSWVPEEAKQKYEAAWSREDRKNLKDFIANSDDEDFDDEDDAVFMRAETSFEESSGFLVIFNSKPANPAEFATEHLGVVEFATALIPFTYEGSKYYMYGGVAGL